MKREKYEELLEPLQVELNNLARWLQKTRHRLVVLLEGRDTAGKTGLIHAITERLNPRQVRVVALSKPTEREQTAWYFQRYVEHLPSAGELVIFDRSWYNRAGVETVMGFCTPEDTEKFLDEAPTFERMITDDGIQLVKYWLAVDQEEQEKRFAERSQDPVKRWKLSPIDLDSRKHYKAYGKARDRMFKATHTRYAPWFVVNFDDQKRGRLNLIRHLLDQIPDTHVPAEKLTLPPLGRKPAKEKFKGAVKPIKERY